MIKVSAFLKKNKNLSLPEFRRHWLNDHVNIVQNFSTSTKNYIRKYIQTQTMHEIHQNERAAYDGIAQLWFESAEKLSEWRDLPELDSLKVDEEVLFDIDAALWLMTDEQEIHAIPRWKYDSKIKIVELVKKVETMSIDLFHNYWSTNYAQLVTSRPWFKNCNRFVQNNTLYTAYHLSQPPLGFNGYAEYWFNSVKELENWREGRLQDQEVLQVEKKFLQDSICFFTFEPLKTGPSLIETNITLVDGLQYC